MEDWMSDWLMVYECVYGIGRRKGERWRDQYQSQSEGLLFCPRSFVHSLFIFSSCFVCVSQDRTTWVTSRWFRPKVLLLPPSFFSLFEEGIERKETNRVTLSVTGSLERPLPQLHQDVVPFPAFSDFGQLLPDWWQELRTTYRHKVRTDTSWHSPKSRVTKSDARMFNARNEKKFSFHIYPFLLFPLSYWLFKSFGQIDFHVPSCQAINQRCSKQSPVFHRLRRRRRKRELVPGLHSFSLSLSFFSFILPSLLFYKSSRERWWWSDLDQVQGAILYIGAISPSPFSHSLLSTIPSSLFFSFLSHAFLVHVMMRWIYLVSWSLIRSIGQISFSLFLSPFFAPSHLPSRLPP